MSAASRRSLLLAAGILAAASVVAAQDVEIPADPDPDGRYGTASSSVQAVHALAFQEAYQGGAAPGPQLFSFIPSGVGILSRHLVTSSTSNNFFAALDLPTGAQIMGLRLESCDTSATGAVTFAFRFTPTNNPSGSSSFSISSGATAAPGCTMLGTATNMVPFNVFVDNEANTYFAQVTLGTTDTANSFRSVRVYYRLRVSPAPSVARFSDVPTTHIFFQFIEALAASGITGGCTSPVGGFCPNDPVTRAQMAVFLATALGLHFPN